MNQTVILGRMIKDAEQKTTKGGSKVTEFCVADNHKYKDKESVIFWDCVLWGDRGDTYVQYVHKGDQILLSGRCQDASYEKKDGTKIKKIDFRVDDFTFVGGKKDEEADPNVPF